jgi:serine/threonine-protein kinase RsbW
MAKWAWDAGMLGIFGEATTAHPYSQRPVLDAGGHELCLMLGYIPARVVYAGVEPTGRRVAAVVTFSRLREVPATQVHAPRRHTEVLRRIYELNELGAAFADGGAARLDGESRFSLHTRPDHDLALIDVHAAGADLADAVAVQLRRLRGAGIEVAHADLPLSDPATPAACEALEALGFSFAGVVPNDDDAGFRLRLQHLPDVEVLRDDITVISDFGTELLDYVLEARAG